MMSLLTGWKKMASSPHCKWRGLGFVWSRFIVKLWISLKVKCNACWLTVVARLDASCAELQISVVHQRNAAKTTQRLPWLAVQVSLARCCALCIYLQFGSKTFWYGNTPLGPSEWCSNIDILTRETNQHIGPSVGGLKFRLLLRYDWARLF